jgi:hypothetical protein
LLWFIICVMVRSMMHWIGFIGNHSRHDNDTQYVIDITMRGLIFKHIIIQ